MIDNSILAFGYAFLVVAGLTFAASVAGIVVVLRELRGTPASPVVTVAGPSDLDVRRAA